MAPWHGEGHRPTPDKRTSGNTSKKAMGSKADTCTQQGITKSPKGKEHSEKLNELRKVRRGEETTVKSTFTEASSWEKQAWEVDPSTHQNCIKAPRLGTWMGPSPPNDLECIRSTCPEADNLHFTRAPDIIWETQPPPKTKGSKYKDIMASIGLDSPNTSTESRME